MNELTHFDANGKAHMVDVGGKDETHRVAIAEGWIHMRAETLAMIEAGSHKKGDVLGIARVAAIMAAKRTSELIPLCHPIPLTKIAVDLETRPEENAVYSKVEVHTRGRTGVEMEALCAVQISLLTIYDMCKAIDRGMSIDKVRLLEKSGGASGSWRAEDDSHGNR